MSCLYFHYQGLAAAAAAPSFTLIPQRLLIRHQTHTSRRRHSFDSTANQVSCPVSQHSFPSYNEPQSHGLLSVAHAENSARTTDATNYAPRVSSWQILFLSPATICATTQSLDHCSPQNVFQTPPLPRATKLILKLVYLIIIDNDHDEAAATERNK